MLMNQTACMHPSIFTHMPQQYIQPANPLDRLHHRHCSILPLLPLSRHYRPIFSEYGTRSERVLLFAPENTHALNLKTTHRSSCDPRWKKTRTAQHCLCLNTFSIYREFNSFQFGLYFVSLSDIVYNMYVFFVCYSTCVNTWYEFIYMTNIE